MKNQRAQGGFTLIELVIVIVILGILAAVAVPKYLDLSTEAEQAAADGVAGALASASAINYAACKAGSTSCLTVDNCEDVGPLLQGGLSDDYKITAAAIAADAAVSCELTVTGSTTKYSFQAIGTEL